MSVLKVTTRFAYVDFATPDAKTLAIALSENNLDGRKLLIKDGALVSLFALHFPLSRVQAEILPVAQNHLW